jgi:RNA polymerase sigma-70 factor (ECF subfamily)
VGRHTLIEQIFSDEWGRVVASLAKFLGDLDLAEDAAADAFAIASERWPRDGRPANARAWLVTTARRVAIDRLRRERTFASKKHLLIAPEAREDPLEDTPIPDERLELIFGCRHPALAVEAQVALRCVRLAG